MLHVATNGAGDQRPRLCRIVEILTQRISYRFRHHNLCRKVDDGIYFAPLQDIRNQRFVAEIPDHEFDAVRHGPLKACRQIVQNDHVFARSSRDRTVWLPIYPAPPVTSVVIACRPVRYQIWKSKIRTD